MARSPWRGESSTDLLEGGRRVLPSTQVGQRPDGVPGHGQSVGFGQKPDRRVQTVTTGLITCLPRPCMTVF